MLLQGREVSIDLHDYVRLGDCPEYYRLVRVLFYQHEPHHFTAAACQADGLWVYLNSGRPVQRMPLRQLQQEHGHEVVAALLITTQQPKDDNNHMLVADYLEDMFRPASDQPRYGTLAQITLLRSFGVPVLAALRLAMYIEC